MNRVLKAWALQGVFSAGGRINPQTGLRVMLVWDDHQQQWYHDLEVKINQE